MNFLKKIQPTSNAIHVSEDGIEIQHIIPTLVSGSVPIPDFPQKEFPSTEVAHQSQNNCLSISDTLHLGETGISLKRASYSTDLLLKSMELAASLKEKRESRKLPHYSNLK